MKDSEEDFLFYAGIVFPAFFIGKHDQCTPRESYRLTILYFYNIIKV